MSFSSTDDESRIISNGRCSSLLDFDREGARLNRHYLSSFIFEIADVELIEDQYRIILAHKNQGIIEIHRINSNMRIQTTKSGSHEHFIPAIEENWSPLGPSVGSGLFGRSTLANSSSSLFSSKPSSGGLYSSSRNMNNNQASIFGGSRRGKSNKISVLSTVKQASKPSKKGKKIQKVKISSKTIDRKTFVNKRKSKVSTVKPSSKLSKSIKKKIQDKEEDNPIEITRIRTKKGGKSKSKEEKVWIVFATEDEENKKEKRGRSKDKKEKEKIKKGKRKIGESEERSRSRSNSKSLTRKSK